MYNSLSFDHSTIEKVSLNTWITTSSVRYMWIVLTIYICSRSQILSFMVSGFFSFKRASINLCQMSTSFTLACHKEKLLFSLNRLIFILIMFVFSIFFDLNQYCHDLGNHMHWYRLALILIVGLSTHSDTDCCGVWPGHHNHRSFLIPFALHSITCRYRKRKKQEYKTRELTNQAYVDQINVYLHGACKLYYRR